MIESDSTLSVGWVNYRVNRPMLLMNDLNLIDALKMEFDCTGVFHSFNEANTTVDF